MTSESGGVPGPESHAHGQGHASVPVPTPQSSRALKRTRAAFERERVCFDAALRQLPVGVAIADAPSGTTSYANECADRLRHRSAAPAADAGRNEAEYVGLHADGRRYEPHEWPLARAVTTGEVVRNEEIEFVLVDGTRRTMSVTARPVRDEAGEITAGVATFDDITERKQTISHLRAQQAVVMTLSQALTDEEATRAVLSAGVEAFGAHTGCAALVTPAGDALKVTGAGSEDEDATVMPRRVPLSAPVPIADAVRECRPVFVESQPEWRRRYPVDAETNMRRGYAAQAAVPFMVQGRAFGAMCLFFRRPRDFDEADRAFGLALAQLCAQALERSRLHDAERAARAETEAANRAKSELFATLSHELRTPINAVVGYAELLAFEVAGPINDAQRTYLERVRASTSHLLGLVNDLLDVAKIDAGRLLVVRENSSARETIETALVLVHPQAIARGLALANRCGEEVDARYRGDPRRVEQIVVNLLSNAVRFTESGGRITVRCAMTDSPSSHARITPGQGTWCAISVEDTGIGIAPENLAVVFDPFVQLDPGLTRTQGGSGLGLSISRRLAHLMNGDLTIESRLREGSTFTLWLPAPPSVVSEGGRAASSTSAADEAHTSGAASASNTGRALGDTQGEVRGPASQTPGLIEVGDAVLRDIEGIVERYMRRLRIDPAAPSARSMKDTDLKDHTATFVTDIAHALGIIEEAHGKRSTLVRHDSEIQGVIAARHGSLRFHLGWDEAELDRDIEILAEEVEAAVRRAVPLVDHTALEKALGVLKRFFERARELSHHAYRQAAKGDPRVG
jgi:signal transduction histidine kinase